MILGKQCSWGAIQSLNLEALDVGVPAGIYPQEIKIYAVPAVLSADRYYVGVREPGAVEDVPACRRRDALLLAHFKCADDGTVTELFVHKEVRNA